MYKFENQLKELIVSLSEGVNVSDINENTNLVKDLSLNSLNIIQLVVEIESAFDIEIDDESLLLDKLAPYNELIEIINVKINDNK